jgi:hypothetical protein
MIGETAVTGAERRIHRRFDLALPMRVRVRAQTPQLLDAATKDISARGLYFNLHGDFELGTELECEVTLPPELCQGNAIQVKCKGRIVRVERGDDDVIGVAATIEDYEFVKTF